MKWYKKKSPKIGDKRIRKAFLVFPMRLGNITKWFETAEWVEEYIRYIDYDLEFFVPFYRFKWAKIRWMEDF